MKQSKSSESGQILILLVLLVVGLLGFTALAIDGGMIFADRRYTQSAADAASLAGAGAAAEIIQNNGVNFSTWSCGSAVLGSSINAAVHAAYNSAGINDYDIGDANDMALGTNGHDHGVKVACYNGASFESDYIEVEVMLSRVTNTSFAHLFTGGVMRNTVYSKTRVKPLLKAGMGNSIVSLGGECEKNEGGGVHFGSGALESFIADGGIYSNTCVLTNGFKADVTIENGDVSCFTGYDCQVTEATNGVNPTYVGIPHPLTEEELYPGFGSRCADASADSYNLAKNKSEIGPGNYSAIELTTGDMVMKPGLYCINSSIDINTNGKVTAEGVTIYFTGSNITLNGGEQMLLTAPNSPDHPPVHNAEEDLLLYVPKDHEVDSIKINGNAGTSLGGTIYAPDADFTLNGTSSTGGTDFAVAMIGRVFNITGDGELSIRYDAQMDAGWPSYIEVQK